MKIALCNEVIRDLPFPAQCELAAALGYDAIELAPFTLGAAPHMLPAGERKALARAASEAGVEIVSLHWLLVTPKGLSIHTPDETVRRRTIDVLRRLIGLCADLGGKVLVHGSPMARQVPDRADPAPYRRRALDTFAAIAPDAEAAGVTYCLEPLAPSETNFLNSLDEARAMVEEIASPALRMMIDCCAAGRTESLPLGALADRWLPTGLIGHVQVNDRNQRAPGQGEDRFAPLLGALIRHRYAGVIAVEPFIYEPDGRTQAARAIGYLRGILEALRHEKAEPGASASPTV